MKFNENFSNKKEQEPQSIYNFKPGDIITRIQKGIHKVSNFNENLGTMAESEIQDGSYMGYPLKFVGIANGMIYVQHMEAPFKDDITSLNIEGWKNGWSNWVDPKILLKNIGQTVEHSSSTQQEFSGYEQMTVSRLNNELAEALKEERYEDAEKIKQEIERRKS